MISVVAIAQDALTSAVPVVVERGAVGWIEGLTAWIAAHTAMVVSIGAVIVEVIFRLWPSDKIRSLLSYGGKLFVALGKLIWLIADILSKVIPDRRAPEKK